MPHHATASGSNMRHKVSSAGRHHRQRRRSLSSKHEPGRAAGCTSSWVVCTKISTVEKNNMSAFRSSTHRGTLPHRFLILAAGFPSGRRCRGRGVGSRPRRGCGHRIQNRARWGHRPDAGDDRWHRTHRAPGRHGYRRSSEHAARVSRFEQPADLQHRTCQRGHDASGPARALARPARVVNGNRFMPALQYREQPVPTPHRPRRSRDAVNRPVGSDAVAGV